MRKTEYASRGSKDADALESARSLTFEAGGDTTADFAVYRDDPAGFARDVLGSRWWTAQTEIADALTRHRRVAVKAANGVGKTFLAADLCLWFLHTHAPSVVLTTAPTWRQVESLLWEEIRRRVRTVNVLAERDATKPKLEGALLQTKLKIAEGHFAMGLSTDEPVRFQGFHADDLLVVLDEACGVPEEIWDAVEGVCVGTNNRVLAISNPLSPAGHFYGLFKSPQWKTFTISALAHPNVVAPDGPRIPGAVTREAVEDRIAAWCEEEDEGVSEGLPEITTAQTESEGHTAAMPDTRHPNTDTRNVVWEGRRYRPNGMFRSRVLGEFPESASDSLFHLDWIEVAMNRKLDEEAPVVLAVDVARFGSDETVLALRRGLVVTEIRSYRGLDTMETARRVQARAREVGAEIVTVDEVGVGAGVVDRLREKGLSGLIPVQFGARPCATGGERQFLNLRAQTFWALRDRLREGTIALLRDPVLQAQMANLRYGYALSGQIQIESKEEIRRRGLPSPDRADALALLFCPLIEFGAGAAQRVSGFDWPRDLRAETVHWSEISAW